jgi:CRISPR-associated protein Csx17
MNEINLAGCSASSLAGYLKAMGILRLVADQIDETARGCWKDGNFVLKTKLPKADLSSYFLDKYIPSPIISPWSGRAGFLEGDGEKQSKRKGAIIIDRIERSRGDRFSLYRDVITSIRNVSVITRLDRARAELKALEKKKQSKHLTQEEHDRLSARKRETSDLKGALLLALRGELKDSFLPWVDACFALVMDKSSPGPLLGSGGNEGSMDFSINHIGYLLDLIDENFDKPTPLAKNLLGITLYGETGLLDSTSNIGFLDTLATGGVNMSAGFEGHPSGNTWDSVLAMEGAVLFASATTKKLESTDSGRPSFPFSVSPSYAGEGSIAARESARPELWLPLWHAPASAKELIALLAEGRATLGRHQVENGIDMLQALSLLGVDRGIAAFERYGFYERRGKGYFVAAYLGSHDVPAAAFDNWMLRGLGQNQWLSRFRRFAQGAHAATRFLVLRKRLEDRLFAFSGREPSKAEAQSLLVLLGETQFALSSSAKAREAVRPIPTLSEQWVAAADDDTPAFRIAKALAGLRGVREEPLPLRAQLFPVHRKSNQWMTPEADEKVRIYTGRKGRLIDTLRTLLERRFWLAEKLEIRDKPLDGAAGVTLEDIDAFLGDDTMDERIAALLPGLSLCEIPRDIERGGGSGAVPAAFALLRLSLTPNRTLRSLGLLPERIRLPVPAGMLAQLAAGNRGNRAVQTAWRRLRASGLAPILSLDALPGENSILPWRAGAALLIPLRYGATAELARAVLELGQAETQTD